MAYTPLKYELENSQSAEEDVEREKHVAGGTDHEIPASNSDTHIHSDSREVLNQGFDASDSEGNDDDDEGRRKASEITLDEPGEGETVKLLADEDKDEVQDGTESDSSLSGVVIPKYKTPSISKSYVIVRYVLSIGAFVMLFAFLGTAITLIALSPSCQSSDSLSWWKTTVIYQCYPRSFQDSDGDGNGDLKGIEKRLDYFVDIGVDTVWLNPIFKSPQRDVGYDVSNYTDVDPLYGSIDDLKSLLQNMHSNSMHLLLDFVPNHTSEEHPWFIESRSSRNNSKRDWYVWADGNPKGGPPNNWLSLFGGSAWTYDNTTDQYYLHQFSVYQPDLNYWNKDVRSAMEDVLKFWFDFGVDGFRIDAVIFLLEDPELHDEPLNPDFSPPNGTDCSAGSNNTACYGMLIHNLTQDYPGIHNITKSWRSVSDLYKQRERFLVGETYDPVETVMKYYGENNDEFHFPFNFLLLGNNDWTGYSVSNNVSTWLDAMPEGAWPNWVLGNHDNNRTASKAGVYLARALNTLLLTLPGTPTTYYGEEILMTDVYVPPNRKKDLYQDRDKERTPMQWNTTANAGFTSSGSTPWLPLAANYTTVNVEVETKANTSILALYKKLVKLRTENKALMYANYTLVSNTTDVYAYHRFHKDDKDEFIIVVNFARNETVALLDSVSDTFLNPEIVLSSTLNRTSNEAVDLTKGITMLAGEAVIIKGHSKNEDCS